ncbi:(Na+)-NQR maturation NqrM [Kushneria sinocarnis]|nr:(Na+)-NQR maturation NqrM [Kushneria sinocarnis]
MTTWLLVLVAMLMLVTAMSVGVLLGRKPIAGSCGGLNQLGLKEGCDICGGNDEVCEKRSREAGQQLRTDLAVDATRQR